jgi:hypothetical protein
MLSPDCKMEYNIIYDATKDDGYLVVLFKHFGSKPKSYQIEFENKFSI